jgi:hypothetical protein
MRWAFVCASMLGCSPPPGNCEVQGTASLGYTYCIDYTGQSYNTMNVPDACMQAGGTFSTGACPMAPNGTCVFNGGTQMEYKYRFDTSVSDGGVDPTGVCTTAGGAFTTAS